MVKRAGWLNVGQRSLHLSAGPGGRRLFPPFSTSRWTAGPRRGLHSDLEKTDGRKGLGLRGTLMLSRSATQRNTGWCCIVISRVD